MIDSNGKTSTRLEAVLANVAACLVLTTLTAVVWSLARLFVDQVWLWPTETRGNRIAILMAAFFWAYAIVKSPIFSVRR